MAVRLNRVTPGHYSAIVRVKGCSMDPFELSVWHDPWAELRDQRWSVESDTERFFPTLAKAREYINRFFEPVTTGSEGGDE